MNGVARIIPYLGVLCDGGCGRHVPQKGEMCAECAELNHKLEVKRIMDAARNRSYGVGIHVAPKPEPPLPRTEYGAVVFSEEAAIVARADHALASMTLREWYTLIFIALVAWGVIGCVGYTAWAGVRMLFDWAIRTGVIGLTR